MLQSIPVRCPACHSGSLTELFTHVPVLPQVDWRFQCKDCGVKFTATMTVTTVQAAADPTSPSPSPIIAGPNLTPEPTIHIGDTIRLAYRSGAIVLGRDMLATYGEWWLVRGGAPERSTLSNLPRPASWILQSIPLSSSKKDLENTSPLYLHKDRAKDILYRVTDICVYPETFHRKNYK